MPAIALPGATEMVLILILVIVFGAPIAALVLTFTRGKRGPDR